MKKYQVVAMYGLAAAHNETQGGELKIEGKYSMDELFKRAKKVALERLNADLSMLDEISPHDFYKYLFSRPSLEIEKICSMAPEFELMAVKKPVDGNEEIVITFEDSMRFHAESVAGFDPYDDIEAATADATSISESLGRDIRVVAGSEKCATKKSSLKKRHLFSLVERKYIAPLVASPEEFIREFRSAKTKVGRYLVLQKDMTTKLSRAEYQEFQETWIKPLHGNNAQASAPKNRESSKSMSM